MKRLFERPEFQHVLPSYWIIARGYELVAEAPGSRLRKIVVTDPRPKDVYIPFQDPDLLLSFIRLATRGKPSDESVLAWVHEHGLLRRPDDNEERNGGKGDRELASDGAEQASEPLEDFVQEALQARSALDLYTDLSGDSIDVLRRRIGTLRDRYRKMAPLSVLDSYFVEQFGSEADRVGEPPSGTLRLYATIKLQNLVTNKLSGVHPALWNDSAFSPYARYRPERSWECPDLVSAMYLQLYLWMTEGLPMKRCVIPTCRTPFPATRGAKRVCSDTCRSNLRNYPELQKHE